MKIYLIRHGQTTGDLEDRYGGDYDDHLTQLGILQAEKLAEELSNSGIERIFTSPLLRAKETAEILGKKLNAEVEVIENLHERNRYGPITGMTKSEALAKFPELVSQVKVFGNTIEGAENFNHFEKRVIAAFYELTLKKQFGTIAAVTHGGPLRVLSGEVLKRTDLKDKMEDCGWALLDTGSETITIEKTSGFLV